jgi:hypothetical protein
MHDVAERQKLQCLIGSFRCYTPHLTPGCMIRLLLEVTHEDSRRLGANYDRTDG